MKSLKVHPIDPHVNQSPLSHEPKSAVAPLDCQFSDRETILPKYPLNASSLVINFKSFV